MSFDCATLVDSGKRAKTLDPITQSECHRDPHYLQPGQAVFFAVLPNFMNVDIRIVLDVVDGITDVYLTPEPKMFIGMVSKAIIEF